MVGRTFMERMLDRVKHGRPHMPGDRLLEVGVEYHEPIKLTDERVMHMLGNQDSIVNNSDSVLRIENVGGALVQVLEPGRVFAPDESITVRLRSVADLTHRTYFNER